MSHSGEISSNNTSNETKSIIRITQAHIVKAVVFPVVMYGCNSWTKRRLSIKKLILLNCSVGEDSLLFSVKSDNVVTSAFIGLPLIKNLVHSTII